MTNISSASSTAPTATTASRPRVLVIEPDVPTADTMVRLLEAAGYQVDIATDSQYGLMLIDSFDPKVILMSTTLPGMSSHDMTQVLRTAPQYASRFPSMNIIYVSDKGGLLTQRFHDLPEIPMSHYIFKPLVPAELLDKVERVLTPPTT